MVKRSIFSFSRHVWMTIFLIGGLYVAEAVPFGFFSQVLPALMRKQGYSLVNIGLSSLLAAPWALKFLWAPLVDRYGSPHFGQRRSWIIPLQCVTAALFIALGLGGPSETIIPLLAVVLLGNLLTATQDIATDGLTVDLLDEEVRGISTGIQSAGFRLGMIIGGGLLLIFYDELGWKGAFVGLGGVLLLMLIPSIAMHEPVRHVEPEEAPSLLFDKNHFIRQPGGLRLIALIAGYRLGDTFAVGMIRPFLIDAGLTIGDIGWLIGTVGAVFALAGSLMGGALLNPLGRRRALLVFGVLQIVTVLGYAYLARGTMNRTLLYVISGAEHFTSGLGSSAMYAVMMDWCRPKSNATDITVQTSALMMATLAASAVCGVSAQKFGYFTHFLISAGLSAVAVLLVLVFFPSRGAATPGGAQVQA
jgi:MFS transporter, PAT family, beta-lactamase induction signal transducer AmpG